MSKRPRLIVDGMNVIGSRPDRWWNDPDRAVRRLIEELDRFGSQTGDDITVVFDRRPPDVSPGPHGAVMVAFASWRGRNAADHEIVRMVSEDPAPASLTVVTAPYHAGPLSGVIGVIGPTRMPYDKVISLVTHASELVTDLLKENTRGHG